MIWLAHGPHRRRPLSRAALALWALVTVTRLVPRLIGAEDRLAHPSPYPQPLAWAGCVYAVCAVLTFLAPALGTARADEQARDPGPERSRSRPHPAMLSGRD
jgi:alpha-1,2-mannosyltransferase